MRLWTLIKLAAGAVVLAVAIFIALLVSHVHHEPLGGIFSRFVPVQFEARPVIALPEASADLPEIDPGEKVFERAREMIAMGDYSGAREKLRSIIYTYPRSKAAPEARRIIGEMNVDEVLSAAHMEGKSVHIVRAGESFLGIASKYDTTLDCIMHLNGLMDLKGLHPGEELVVMPLKLRIVIEPSRRALSLWDEGRFIKEYAVTEQHLGSLKGGLNTRIASKSGVSGARRLTPGMKEYRDSDKIFTLENSPLQIRGLTRAAPADDAEADAAAPKPARGNGFFLSPEDAEELCLLLRPGNEVEIRAAAP